MNASVSTLILKTSAVGRGDCNFIDVWTMLKVILITDKDPVDSWVAAQIAEQYPISHTLLLGNGSEQRSEGLRQKLWASPLRVLSAIPRELIRRRVESRREEMMAEQLWAGNKPPLQQVLPNVIEVETAQMNSDAVAQQIQTLAPDLILVCGGPILSELIYSIPRLGSWNLQWGISDRYRGQHGIFFPLVLGDFDAIGATLHRIDSGINTGEALFQFRPALQPDDTESSLEIKIARAIVPQLVNLLTKLAGADSVGDLSGKAVDPQRGQQVCYRDRTAWLEVQHYLKRRLGMAPVPARPATQTLFLRSPELLTTL